MRYLTLLLLVFSFFCLNAQDCPPGDVTITCQDEFDAFEAQYPNCIQINGNLTLMDDEYTCLTLDPNFPALERITGTLHVWTWMSADAFPNLQYVGGGIGTDDEFGGTFAVLDTVMGSVSMDNSYQGVSFPTCPQLKYVGGSLGIYTDEGGIFDSHDFPALEHIGGDLYDYSNWTDSDFSGFINLRYIGGDVDIEEGEIGGWNALDTIGGDLILRRYEFDQAVVNIDITGMNQLQYIGGNFKLSTIDADANQQCVKDLSGLSQLNYIGGDFEYIWQYEWDGSHGCSNPLTTLNGLQQLKEVGGNVTIDGSVLLNLGFLTQLESIGGNLEITDNDLESIEGLNHIVDIGGELIIEDNPSLSECAVQAVCYHINTNGVTTIGNNMVGCNSVAEVEALCPSSDCLPDGITFSSQAEIDNFASNYSGCVVVQGAVIIEEAVSGNITNLDSLAQIGVINGSLTIQNNTALVSLSGLDNLNEIAGDIIIQNNTVLNDIFALSDLNHTNITNLQISNNNNLAECAITSVCNYFIIGGTATISNNATDCNTIAEIEVICGSGICPPGDVVLETQQDIDAYFLNYPGCTQINGHLKIGDDNSNDIYDLSSFSNVESLSGNLRIELTENLTNLEGLNNLQSIGGSLSIIRCASLSDISALSNLHTIGGGIGIILNVVLSDLYGLHNVSNFDSNCEIYGNDALVSLSNLSIHTANNLTIRENDALVHLNSLQQLDTLTGTLKIWDNDNLTTLNGLQLKTANMVDIWNNQSLNSLQGLHNLESVSGLFYIEENTVLPDLDGLQALRTVGTTLKIKENNLVNFQGLNNLESVGHDFDIISNPTLVNFEGLDALNAIGQSLNIQENQTLINIQGIQNLENIGSNLVVEQNPALTNFDGLQGLTNVVGRLAVEENNALINFEGLNALQSIGHEFVVRSNPVLINFEGLDELNHIEQNFSATYNTSLVSLEGLENLEHVRNIFITNNNILNTLYGIQNINHEYIWKLYVRDNPSLSECAVQSVCDYLAVSTSYNIANNASGCNSVEEVELVCQALPIEMTAPLRVHLKDKTAILQWRTDTEINNAGFEVQRSKDGIDWKKIGWQVGQGSTTTPQSYTHTDPNPLFGTSYYRFKQVDFNGATEYSNVVSLQYVRNSVTVYPNPVKEQLYLRTDYSFVQKITIYNSTGNQVAEITNPGTDIDISTLPKGIYILKITVDNEDFYEKILVE